MQPLRCPVHASSPMLLASSPCLRPGSERAPAVSMSRTPGPVLDSSRIAASLDSALDALAEGVASRCLAEVVDSVRPHLLLKLEMMFSRAACCPAWASFSRSLTRLTLVRRRLEPSRTACSRRCGSPSRSGFSKAAPSGFTSGASSPSTPERLAASSTPASYAARVADGWTRANDGTPVCFATAGLPLELRRRPPEMTSPMRLPSVASMRWGLASLTPPTLFGTKRPRSFASRTSEPRRWMPASESAPRRSFESVDEPSASGAAP